jgi:tRNA(His) 5'-end guanylyltransferase
MEPERKEPEFATLEERMLSYRAEFDLRIPRQSYALCMLDGRSFSHMVKKRYKRPFDDNFIKLMYDTAAYVCSQVQGAKFAFVLSDEISIFFTDKDAPESTLFYDGRIVKLLSIIPAIATSYFNKHVLDDKLAIENISASDLKQIVESEPMYQFDCKVWTVPSLYEVMNWFLYRQRDCMKNSKGQAAQAYLSHKQLLNLTSDEQIALLKEEKNIDWFTNFNDGEKYGRFIYKEKELHSREIKGEMIEYERSVWKSHYGHNLNTDDGKKWFVESMIAPFSFPEEDKLPLINREYGER